MCCVLLDAADQQGLGFHVCGPGTPATAACIGREFGYRVLAAVAGLGETQLQGALDQLVGAELVFRRGTPPEAVYSFKHSLVRDTAYESLLRSRRQQLHGKIANALEQQVPDMADVEPETVAYHLTEAGFAERAVEYWLKAGHRASSRSAHKAAISHFAHGLQLLAGPGRCQSTQMTHVRHRVCVAADGR
jgi:predicted ATPase